jgi:ATP-binding cassette subfamily G (WHITE) protein 1
LIAIALVASGLGLMNGAMFSNVKVAIAVTPALLLPFMLFSGLYENLDSIPLWIGWI